MINVAKGSLWYRLALYGVFFQEYDLSPNLCPFMRRVLLGIVMILIYVTMGAFLIMCLATPFLQFFMAIMYGGHYLVSNVAMVIGLTIWGLFIFGVICWFFADTETGKNIKTKVGAGYDSLHIGDNLVIQWILAMHHKMCPHIDFTGNIEDAEILNTETE